MQTDVPITINPVSHSQYQRYIQNDNITFLTDSFCELNKSKVDEIVYLLVQKGSSPRFALCFGIKDSIAKCPFSAPFGLPVPFKKNVGIDSYDMLLDALQAYAQSRGWREIRFTLPPLFYQREELSGLINAFFRKGYQATAIDINYAFDLRRVYSPEYESLIHYNARKNLKIAQGAGLWLSHCQNREDIALAYDIIAQNRASKGYPLRMSYQEVNDTIKIVAHEVFLVYKSDESIAAALVYRITDKIAQVIYWGDRPGFGNVKPINFLAYELIQYYGRIGLDYLDIGPSTEDSIPNYGLCDFKESIGCERDIKLSFTRVLLQGVITEYEKSVRNRVYAQAHLTREL